MATRRTRRSSSSPYARPGTSAAASEEVPAGQGKGRGKRSNPPPSKDSEVMQQLKLMQEQQLKMQKQLEEVKASSASQNPSDGASLEQPSQDQSGQLPTPFISISHEIDSHVPASIKAKIAKSEYVNLAFLLEGSLDVNREQAFDIKVAGLNAFGGNEAGNIVLRGPGPRRKIESIETWTDAFLVFTHIFAKTHPSRQNELLTYMRSIRRAAKYGGIGYKLYDEKFRLAQADNPARSWATIDSELWLLFVAGRGPTTPNFRPQTTHQSASRAKTGTCNQFNQTGSCRYGENVCRFYHKCAKCQSSQHGAYACATRPQSQQPQ